MDADPYNLKTYNLKKIFTYEDTQKIFNFSIKLNKPVKVWLIFENCDFLHAIMQIMYKSIEKQVTLIFQND